MNNNNIFITTISKGLNVIGFMNADYVKTANDLLQKGEVTDSLRYDNNFKYTKTGKEIKSALERAKSAYQLKKDDLANQMSMLKEKLAVKPFAPISSWQMRGFEKQLGLQFNYPYEFFRFVEYPSNDGGFKSYDSGTKMTTELMCTRLNKRYSCTLEDSHFPTTVEASEPYYTYNRLVEEYIGQAVDILQLNIMIKNMNEKKTFELSQSQMLALDQYMDDKADDLEKGQKDELEKGGVGSGRTKYGSYKFPTKSIGKTKSGKEVFAHMEPKEYKDFSAQDHLDAAEHHSRLEGEAEDEGASYRGDKDDDDDEADAPVKDKEEWHHDIKMNHKTAAKKTTETKGGKGNDELKKAYEVLGFDEELNDIEKADNKGGDEKAEMHTNGGDPEDCSNMVMTNGDDHFIDTLDADGKVKYKVGDKVKYKLDDDDTKYKGTVTEDKHPSYDQALKIKHNKKKAVEVG